MRLSLRRESLGGTTQREEGARRREMSGRHRRTVGGQIGAASKIEVEGFELPCRLQKQRGRIVPVAADDGNVPAEQCSSGALEPIERVGLRVATSRSTVSNAPARNVASAATSPRSARRDGSGVSSAARWRNAAAAATPPRACARPADRSSSMATSSSGSAAAAARCQARRSGSSIGVRRLGERSVHQTALGGRRFSVHHRADKGMTEANPGLDLEQARRRRRFGRLRGDADRRCGREDQAGSPSGSAAATSSRRRVSSRERAEAPPEALLDLGGNRKRVRQAETAGECGRCPTSRQLEKRERVAGRLRKDPLADRLVDATWDRRDEDGPGVWLLEGSDR